MRDSILTMATALLPGFADYLAAERRYSPVTCKRYEENH